MAVTQMAPTIRVALVDDHPLMCEGLRDALSHASDVEVVAEAHTGADAISMMQSVDPDVVLLDYRLPDTDGIALLREFKSRSFAARIVMLTCFAEDRCVRAAIDNGAFGFLTKRSADQAALIDAVRKAYHRLSAVSPDALTSLLTTVRGAHDDNLNCLTRRELEVWRLVSRGQSNADIAHTLFLSERTVKFHIGNILRKTQTRSRSEATALAYRTGLMDEPS